MNKYPWYCVVQFLLSYSNCQYTLIRMHNFDIELGVIFGIYTGLRLSFRVRKHFKIYCPKDSTMVKHYNLLDDIYGEQQGWTTMIS